MQHLGVKKKMKQKKVTQTLHVSSSVAREKKKPIKQKTLVS